MPLPEEPVEQALYDAPQPFAPDAVPPTSESPAPSSTAPGVFGDTSGDDGERPDESPGEGVTTFDPRYRDDFEGLLFIGRLSGSFRWLGHQFVIRTLTTKEFIEIGVLSAPYRNTDAAIKANQCGIIAACVQSVDGRNDMTLPLTRADGDTKLANRFQYVMQNWYAPTLDKVYEEYLKLELRVREVIQELGER